MRNERNTPWIAIGVALFSIVFNLVTFGELGYFLYAIGDGVASFVSMGSLGRIDGDFYWPIAIWMGIWWPIGAFLIWFLMFQTRSGQVRTFRRYPVFVAAIFVFTVMLAGVFHVGAASLSTDYVIEENRIIFPD